MSWKSQVVSEEEGVARNLHLPGSWWSSEDNEELIQIIEHDHILIDDIYPINFKYWTGPNTNKVSGCDISKFYSKWHLKSK